MAVSGDGRRALSGAWHDTLLWDLEPGERLEPQEQDTLQIGDSNNLAAPAAKFLRDRSDSGSIRLQRAFHRQIHLSHVEPRTFSFFGEEM